MKKNVSHLTLVGFFIVSASFSVYSQPELAPGFKYNGEGSVQIAEKNWDANTNISFAVYDDGKVVTMNQGTRIEYKAGDVLGFTHKASGKKFISASVGKIASAQFVEDLTPDNKKVKVAKAFLADDPLMQKDSVIMGSWLHYILLIKDDGSRTLVSGYKKIAEFVKPDCPELSKKISSKEKGYFLGLMAGSVNEEIEIYHRIASEYEQCKTAPKN
jgi:hypothetical protein